MNDIFGEQLLATIHLTPIISGEHPFVTKMKHAEAYRLLKTMRREIRAFFDDEPLEKGPKPAPFDYLKTLDRVSRPLQPQDLEKMIDAHQEPQDAIDMLIPLTRAIAFLSGQAPRRTKQTLTGAIQMLPSDQEIERFRRVYVVVDDPLAALRKLRALAILGDEVAAFASVYPGLYSNLGDIVDDEMAAAKARKGAKWNLPSAKERQLMALMQMAPSDSDLVKDMQATFGDQPQPGEDSQQPQPKSRIDLKSESFRTSAQASEGGGR